MPTEPQECATVENQKNAPWWEIALSNLSSTKQLLAQIPTQNPTLDYVKLTSKAAGTTINLHSDMNGKEKKLP